VGRIRAAVRLQFLELQLQLLDLPRQLLRLPPKLHAMQLGQQQLQVLELALPQDQLLMLCQDQRAQRFVRKTVQIGERRHCHARSIA